MKKQKHDWVSKILAVSTIMALGFFQGGMPFVTNKALAQKEPLKSDMQKFFSNGADAKKVQQQNVPTGFEGKKTLKSANNKPDVVTGQVLVKFRPETLQPKKLSSLGGGQSLKNFQDNVISQFSSKHGLTSKSVFRKGGVAVFDAGQKGTDEAIKELKKDPSVLIAQPNFKYHTSNVNSANDPGYANQWGLHNTGQNITVNEKIGVGAYSTSTSAGTAGADIKAPEAWAVSDGSAHGVTVAVIDTGVAYNHPDLAPNMWNGANCVDENGAAIIGGCPNHGWDFDQDALANTDGDSDPFPGYYGIDFWTGTPTYFYFSHGTHVAGIIAGADNDKGMVGVAPHAKIMAVKTADLTTDEIVKGIEFAENNGAKVINASWGGEGEDEILKDAIANFSGLFVAAAGNEGGDASFPCADDLDNIICVAATDQNDNLTGWSNYSDTAVDVAAPGDNILSSIGDNDFAFDNFENLSTPALPSYLTKSLNSHWQSKDVSSLMSGLSNLGVSWNKAVGADGSNPYLDNSNTTLASGTFDFSDARKANFYFNTACDTPLDALNWNDYMALEISGDNGSSWKEIGRWDSSLLASTKSHTYATGTFYNDEIDNSLLTSNFKYRFRWVSDGSDNNYGGCIIDDLWATAYTNGAPGFWDYYSGTSMATPFVSGLAALLWGTDDGLTAVQVKDVVSSTGDSLTALSGKTVSGKRINALSALNELSDDSSPSVTALGTGERDFTAAADSSVQLVFNEAISSSSKKAVEQAVTDGLTASGFGGWADYVWDGYSKILTIYFNGSDAIFNNDVTANVSDVMGNNTTDMLLIRSSSDETAPVISGVVDGNTYSSAVAPTFNEGTANLNGDPFVSGTSISENGSYTLVVTDAAGNTSSASFALSQNLAVNGVLVQNKTKSSATITWTTSMGSTGSVSYGKTKKKLSSSISDSQQSTSHSLTIKGLKKNTAYYFKIDAYSNDGQSANTNIRQFKTAKK